VKSEELSEQLKKAGISNEIWALKPKEEYFIFTEQDIKQILRHNHAVVLECPKGQPIVVISAARAQNLLIDKPKEDDKTINNLREFINKHTNTIAKHSLLNMDLANALELERDTSAKLRQQLAARNNQHPETKPRRGLLVTLFPWRRV